MPAVPITLDGVLYDLHNRTTQRVILIGDASLSGVGVGGGPIVPPEQPPHIWGPTDPRPSPPIANVPGVPRPPGDHIWGPTDPRPSPPIANVPGLPPMPDPPANPTEPKPPPDEGGWGWHPVYGWGYFPMTGGKPQPGLPIDPNAPVVNPLPAKK